ncbi:Hsp20/alpha crystallin family protein [Balneola sp. MJW-20]|uniref:Hsp20/alpha crystallin family protein n=1 Tax=Gracilimonas aurantiaca TaxID=3234185 RepID=UPI003466467C
MKTLTNKTDLSPLEMIRRDMDRMFDDMTPFSKIKFGNGGFGADLWAPETDLIELDEAYKLTVDLPGLNKNDVEVSYKDHRLVISGERKEETDEKKNGFIRKERYTGTFTRAFTLPSAIKEDQIKASFKNGVLTVMAPKAEVKKPKLINID